MSVRGGPERNFCVYYGRNELDAIKTFDLAIVEPTAYTKKDIDFLKSHHVKVFAYISMMEIRLDEPDFSRFSDCLIRNEEGSILKNERFNTFYANLGEKKWIDRLTAKAKKWLGDVGYDGLFLDTIGNLEDSRLQPNETDLMLQNAVQWMISIKSLFPHARLIQNNGLGFVLSYTKTIVDGICWENPSILMKTDRRWTKMVLKKLHTLPDKMILLLTESSIHEKTMKKFANKYGFLYYNAHKDYLKI